MFFMVFFFFQAEDGIRDFCLSRGLGDVYKRQVGGGARSELWVQIVSDITQRPVRVCSAGEVSAQGAAVLALGYLDGRPAGSGPTPEPDGHDVVPDRGAAGTAGGT